MTDVTSNTSNTTSIQIIKQKKDVLVSTKEILNQSLNPEWKNEYIDWIRFVNFIRTMGKHPPNDSNTIRKNTDTRSMYHMHASPRQLLSVHIAERRKSNGRKGGKHVRSSSSISMSGLVKHQDSIGSNSALLTRRSRLMSLSGCELKKAEGGGGSKTTTVVAPSPIRMNHKATPNPSVVEYKSEQEEFCSLLDKEIEKSGLFILQRQGHISSCLKRLVCQSSLHEVADANELQQVIVDYIHVGVQLMEMMLYMGVNLTLVEHVLQLHDEIARKRSRTPLLLHQFYIISRGQVEENSFLPLLSKYNASLQALVGSYLKGLEELEPSLLQQPIILDLVGLLKVIDTLQHNSISNYLFEGSLGNNLFFENMHHDVDVDVAVAGGDSVYYPRHLHIRYFAKLRSRASDMYYYTCNHQDRVLSAAPAGGENGDGLLAPTVLPDSSSDPADILANDRWPFALHLNLIATLLYMTNYSVASPTSVRYVSALGGDDAFAAMLIGATPWAVLVSTLFFSVITNYSFKIPMLVAILFLCIGNFLYAEALNYQSLKMVMAGRVFIGLSSLRVINRRYIADTAPMHQRTQISVAFVTYSAIGTALGPLLAAFFQHCHFIISLPSLPFSHHQHTILFNGLTAPGYVCLLLWFFFMIAVIFFFSEPTRVGLHQQQKNTPTHCKDTQYPHTNEELQSLTPIYSNHDQYSKHTLLPPKIPPHKSYDNTTTFHTIDDATTTTDLMNKTSTSSSCILPNITWPVALCLILLFINKLSIESLISSSPIITEHRYQWSVHNIAALAFIIGLVVIPLSITIGYLSRTFHDGQLLLWLFYFTLFGLVLLLDFTQLFPNTSNTQEDAASEDDTIISIIHHLHFAVDQHQYIYGCIFSFVGLQAMESLIMSTLSKVVPYELAVGTCNSGLLNTEIGTLGRAIGDLMVTYIGFYYRDHLLDFIVLPLGALLLISLLLVKFNFDIFSI